MLRPVPGEQAGRIANLARIHRRYVAFTRARNLLVLTTAASHRPVQPHLEGRRPLAMRGPGLLGTPAVRDCRGCHDGWWKLTT